VFELGEVILKKMWAFQYATNPTYIYTLSKRTRLSGSHYRIRGLGYPEKTIINNQQLELIRYGQFLM